MKTGLEKNSDVQELLSNAHTLAKVIWPECGRPRIEIEHLGNDASPRYMITILQNGRRAEAGEIARWVGNGENSSIGAVLYTCIVDMMRMVRECTFKLSAELLEMQNTLDAAMAWGGVPLEDLVTPKEFESSVKRIFS